jgi:transcription elongation factor Elf1
MKKLSFLLAFSLSLVFASCATEEKRTTKTTLYSEDFKTAEERVEELKKHIAVYSDFSDAQFEIFNVNGNFTNERLTIPGASSWDYQFVIKLTKENIDQWISEMVLVDTIANKDSMHWVADLNKKMTDKILQNEPGEFYKGEGKANYAVVFRNSGLLFRKIVNE